MYPQLNDLRYAAHNYMLNNLIRWFDKLCNWKKVRKLSVINDSIFDLCFYRILKHKVMPAVTPECIPWI